MNKNAKLVAKWLIPALLMIWFPARFYWDITHYYTHFGDLLAGFIRLVGLIFCVIWIIRSIRQKNWLHVAFVVLAAASCLFFGFLIDQVPFCIECDHFCRSDLHPLLEPFADKFAPYWDELVNQ